MQHNAQARAFSSWIRAKAISGRGVGALEVIDEERRRNPALDVIAKAAVTAMDSSNTSALRRQSRAFLDIAQRRSILGQLGATPAPPYTPIPTVTSDPTIEWTGEGLPAPVAKLSLEPVTTGISSFRFILAFSKELVRTADDRGLSLIERHSIRAIRRAEDRMLLSDDAGVEGMQPAGLLAGLSPISTGSPAALTDDLVALWELVSDADADRPFFILSPRAALYLATLREGDGPMFPNVGPLGGAIAGVPVLTSRAAGNKLILVDASRLVVTDEGLEVESSEHAAVQMDSAPSAGAAHLVSGFQTNTAFVRFVRYLHWTLTGGDDSIAYIELPLAGSPA